MLSSCVSLKKNDPYYPGNILHIFAKNSPVKRHSDNQLKHIPQQLITIPAEDEVPKNSKIALHHYFNQKSNAACETHKSKKKMK